MGVKTIFFKTVKIVFLCFFCLPSCVFRPASGGPSSQVQVFVNPYGEGDEVEIRSGLATILRQAGDRPCRPSSPDPRSIADTLEKYELLENKESPIFDIFASIRKRIRKVRPMRIPIGEEANL